MNHARQLLEFRDTEDRPFAVIVPADLSEGEAEKAARRSIAEGSSSPVGPISLYKAWTLNRSQSRHMEHRRLRRARDRAFSGIVTPRTRDVLLHLGVARGRT